MLHPRVLVVALVSGLAAALSAQTLLPAGPACIAPVSGRGCLPLAPASQRVDLVKPTFSNPTAITNPLHPSSTVDQIIYGGRVDGKVWRTEFTRLPGEKTIEWDDKAIRVVTWQYLAFSDGRIDEVALDWFAQADDGAVWYFGEDVFNYVKGRVADTDGTWVAGRTYPPGMIMPARPRVGDVYRPENIPGVVFEEVVVKAIGQTVAAPRGPVNGAVVVSELHMDGQHERKVFAPGYGEFSTGEATGDLEQVSIAVPTDARGSAVPAALAAFTAVVGSMSEAIAKQDWPGASSVMAALRRGWDGYRGGSVPELLQTQMNRDVAALQRAVAAKLPTDARNAALRVAQNDLDLHLQHEPVTTVDRARLVLWVRQTLSDASASQTEDVAGDVTSLEWTWRRVRHAAGPLAVARVDSQLQSLRRAADAGDLSAVSRVGAELMATVTVR